MLPQFETGMPIGTGELHLWLVAPAVVEQNGEGLWAPALEAAEQKRHDLLADAGLKRAFLGRRAVLRRLLGAYCGIPASQLRLIQPQGGKPSLAPSQAGPQFSISSSAGWLLLAFSSDQAVGVDVEQWRDDVGLEAIVQRHFSLDEARSLQGLGEEQKLRSFFQIWTRKEAVLKLFGLGLDGLGTLQSGPPGPDKAWVEELHLPPGLSGSVALPRAPLDLQLRTWGQGPAHLPEPGERRILAMQAAV